MSLRRRSCEACFKGRRKCDLSYPTCTRCQSTKKRCRYVSTPPPRHDLDRSEAAGQSLEVEPAITNWSCSSQSSNSRLWDVALDYTLQNDRLIEELLCPISNTLGELGEVQPMSDMTPTWDWVMEQLKQCPRSFAQDAEALFIQKAGQSDPVPRPLRAAVGVCAAHVCMSEENKSIVFHMLDAEMTELLQAHSGQALLEELSNLQAMVLYQTIRLFHGDVKQRIIAEQQVDPLKALGLRLLRRAETELYDRQPSWDTWILAESIRRTVMVMFILYGIHSVFKYGICLELPTLSVLPVSSTMNPWQSRAVYSEPRDQVGYVKYAEFAEAWLGSPPRKLDPFEKLLLVSCKGIEQVEAWCYIDSFSSSADT